MKGYKGLENHEYKHEIINHSVSLVDKINEIHINIIEGNWAALKHSTPKRYLTKNWSNYIYIYLCLREITVVI